jgi:short-subunit dehydrogenase
MCTAVLRISNAAARAMVPRGTGTIINVGSASAWITTGNYSAIKRWVVSYTQALALELEGSGVQATVVNPGWVRTQFHAKSGVPRPKVPRWVWVDVNLVAETALADAAAGKVVSIPTAKWRFALWVAQHGPQGIVRSISRRIVFSRTGRG